MIDKSLIKGLLDNLRSSISKMENMDASLEEILKDEDIQDLLDRRMQVAIETCIDIASHLVAGMDLPRKEKAADALLLLGEKGIISQELADKMVGAVGLRNIIVHEYTDVDYQLAYSDLKEKLRDLKSFGREVLEFIGK